MFGILQKMDRFSNGVMAEEEKIGFFQEIVDNKMIYEMHEKYQHEAVRLVNQGKVSIPLLRQLAVIQKAQTVQGFTVPSRHLVSIGWQTDGPQGFHRKRHNERFFY